MRRLRNRSRVAAVSAVLIAVVSAGCGSESGESDFPPNEFERALEGVGEGVSASSSGFGWVDLEGFRDHSTRERARLALALGPGADDLLRRPGRTVSSLGSDPRDAEDAISISGSYTLGVRFNGIPGGPLARRLRAAGARERREGEWRLFDLGGWSESQVRGPLAPLGAYASRVATASRAVVLTRFGPAREALIGAGESPPSDPTVALAASCVGPAEAARTLPGTFTHNKATSPDLLAVGRSPDGSETICALGDSAEAASEQADAMESAFDPEASDPVTGQPIGELVAESQVDTLEQDGASAARATLNPAPGTTAGFVFGAIVRGSLLTYTGSEPPISDEVARRLRRERTD